MKMLHALLNQRLRALILKEFRQMLRDRRVMAALVIAPVIQLLVFGYVLSPTVTNVSMGIVDESATPESRELVAALVESRSFRLADYYDSVNALGNAIGTGKLDSGAVIPYDYARDLRRERPATVLFLLNATNANTATIAQAYVEGVLQSYNAQLSPTTASSAAVVLQPAFLYNPGLVISWFMLAGILGMLLILVGSTFSSTLMVKERATGTIEQLLMSPATTTEIIVAKMTPLFLAFSVMGLFALVLIRYLFGVPFNGSIAVVLGAGALCILCGISLGTFIATITKTARQAQLSVFFLNPPLTSLSGAFTPVQAMPHWLQPVTVFDPITHFAAITRGALIKGSGFDVLWPDFFALLVFTFILFSLSVWRYRAQL
ncbi:MAG TPA: ABC transporter permease [Candidatus Tyrphobacter sp.]